MTYDGSHDGIPVALSILIAIFASYTALDLATRMIVASGRSRWAWLGTAALALGGGIWSMHFVAMLAFRLPGITIGYDVPLTLASLVLPIGVTALGFFVVDRWGSRRGVLAASGLVMGLGIVGMHYAGMAAMRLPAELQHEPVWVAVAVVVAIGAAFVALRLAFRHSGPPGRIGAAMAMGLAIAGMHYIGMHGAVFVQPGSPPPAGLGNDIGQMPLALWVTGTTVVILAIALVAAALDRHLAGLAAREADALRESEERFRLMVQSVTDYAIFMLDRSGHVANWNSGARRIKGYEAHEIVGQHFSCFYTQEDRARGVPEQALRIAERDGRFEAEGDRVRKDGSRFLASVVIEPIRDDAGEIIGFAKVTRDVTERRRAQDALDEAREALAQAQKMEALGQLTGGVAHDFNNLLMAILSSLELLRKRAPTDPRTTRLIDNAIAGAQRGATLTRRMLAFARRQELRPSAVDIPSLVQGMSELLQRSIGPGVRIETRFPLGLPPALVDAHQLELALLNLCVNARDAMPDGGTITVTGAFTNDTREGAEAGMVCLSVGDTGIGMDDATLARALEPFFTTKGVGKGTGLGLPMVQGLAAQSRGRLVLRSRPGEGTTAEVWLPVAVSPVDRACHERVPAVPETGSEGRPLQILVVDDDPLVRESAVAMLDDLGHRAVAASSGAEALGILEVGHGIDVVVTDHAMPVMTGLELLRRIAEAHPGLPVVLATGYAELAEGIEPAIVQLRKPFGQADIAAALRAAMLEPEASGTVVPLRSKSSSRTS
ncbi:MHYT domain-containing protein [Salinarimonas rosea]|uniref:MHYT domain-containing protein n=1 Tax=Salinarimonas rosea TaxID=552063 RepID=UPI0003F9B94F|nr:MHYT domain-containing protein [Salinarimonas rosea]